MTVLSEKEELKDLGRQVKVALGLCNQIRNIHGIIVGIETTVEDYKAQGSFDLIPVELKQALNRHYQMLLQLKTALEADADFDAIIGG